MKLEELLIMRRSVRNYQDREVPLEVIKEIINESTLAPSAGETLMRYRGSRSGWEEVASPSEGARLAPGRYAVFTRTARLEELLLIERLRASFGRRAGEDGYDASLDVAGGRPDGVITAEDLFTWATGYGQ